MSGLIINSYAYAGGGADPGGVGIAPTYVAMGTPISSAGGANPLPLPAGIVAGDILIAFMETPATVADDNFPTDDEVGNGWFEIVKFTSGSSSIDPRLSAYWYRCTGSDVAPVVSSNGNHFIGRIIAFRGCKPTGSPVGTPTQATITTPGAGSGSPHFIPGCTSLWSNSMIINLFAQGDSFGTTNWSNVDIPGGITEAWDGFTSSGNDGAISLAYGIAPVAKALADTRVQNVYDVQNECMSMFELKAAPA